MDDFRINGCTLTVRKIESWGWFANTAVAPATWKWMLGARHARDCLNGTLPFYYAAGLGDKGRLLWSPLTARLMRLRRVGEEVVPF